MATVKKASAKGSKTRSSFGRRSSTSKARPWKRQGINKDSKKEHLRLGYWYSCEEHKFTATDRFELNRHFKLKHDGATPPAEFTKELDDMIVDLDKMKELHSAEEFLKKLTDRIRIIQKHEKELAIVGGETVKMEEASEDEAGEEDAAADGSEETGTA